MALGDTGFAQYSQCGLPQPATALVVRNSDTGANEFSSVLEYSKVDFQSAVALRVILPDGKTVSIPRAEVAVVFQYPDPLATLSGSTDAQSLSVKRAEAISLGTRFPNAKPAMGRVIAGIDADLQKLAAGQVRYSGVWQTPAAAASSGSGSGDLPSLTFKGKTYQHLTLSRLDKGSIILTHEGGILRVPLGEAGPELIHAIQAKPVLFQFMKVLPAFTLGSQKLISVTALDLQGDPVVLWHQGGLLSIPASQLNKAQLQVLASTNPDLHWTAASGDAPTVADSASTKGRLVLTEGQGKRDPERGWLCPGEEKKQWQSANGEELILTETSAGFVERLERFSDHPSPDLPALDPAWVKPGYYEKALTFINSRIAPYEIGYNDPNQCLVLRRKDGTNVEIQAAFQPGNVDPNIRYKVDNESAIIRLEGRDGAQAITFYHHEVTDKAGDQLWRNQVEQISLPLADPDDAARVAKALMSLLILMGARTSAF
jgi:hypothetical protein